MSQPDPSKPGEHGITSHVPAAHGITPHPAPAPAAASHQLAESDLAVLHAEDKVAARHIVGLMLGIFIMGVAGYLAVCFWVAGS